VSAARCAGIGVPTGRTSESYLALITVAGERTAIT
jgi:hypothetical protein